MIVYCTVIGMQVVVLLLVCKLLYCYWYASYNKL